MKHLLETVSERRILQKLANQHFHYKEILWNLQLFQRADVATEGEVCKSHFMKRQYCTYKEFFIYARKKNAKSLKYSSNGILLLVKLQAKSLLLYLEINLFTNILKYFAILLTLICIEWVSEVPSNIFSATNFN